MKSIMLVLLSLLVFAAAPFAAAAAPLKAYVSEFKILGGQNNEGLKQSLQGMLASRLNPEQVQLVESKDKAELLIDGSYSSFGKLFSLDVQLKHNDTGALAKVFEQGEGQDDLIPAVNRLARKIDAELAQGMAPARQEATPAAVPAARPEPAAAPVAAPVAGGYAIRPAVPDEKADATWSSGSVDGVFTGIALGRLLPDGAQEFFIAGDHQIRYYEKGKGLKLVAEVSVPLPAKILAIDTADIDKDGVPELYVTIMDRESLNSRVYRPDGAQLAVIAKDQPWFYRGIGPDMATRTIYAQSMGTGGNFYGDVVQLVKNGDRFEAGTPVKLPRFGTILNFSLITMPDGSRLFAVLNEDGYLVVFDQKLQELWKSVDKFGGSEGFFKRKDYTQIGNTGDMYRWTFLEQRMIPLPDGTLLVPHNEGALNIGNNRAYSKHTMFALQWNGVKLVEKWHSLLDSDYLADFAYATATREVVLLEVVKKDLFTGGGKSAIFFNRVD